MNQGEPILASLEHVVFYPEKDRSRYATIVALHGRGTDESDLIPLVDSLGLEDVFVVAPRAPTPFGLGPGFAWYVLKEEGVPEPDTFLASLGRLREFLAEIKTGYPVDQQRIVLLGFSQGTVMAYAAGLLEPSSVRGIVALSGYIPVHSGLSLNLHELNGLDTFVSHGTYDELIPVRFGREAAELLKKAGAHVVYREYAMGHAVSENTMRDIATWAKGILSH
jgi:phospholipase/carboxylesterase